MAWSDEFSRVVSSVASKLAFWICFRRSDLRHVSGGGMMRFVRGFRIGTGGVGSFVRVGSG